MAISPKTKMIAVASAMTLAGMMSIPLVSAATPPPLTYDVTVDSFFNNRLYNNNTTQNASTIAPAGEPQIESDANGNLFLASEYGLGGGTGFWTSSDAGSNYLYDGIPNSISSSSPAQPGGGDTSVAIAPVKSASGNYNVYMSSLSLANIDVSTSTDGGKTFTTNYASSNVPGDDREWIAASGASTVYLSYHDVTTDNIDVERSDDAGQTWTIMGEAINPLSNSDVIAASNDNELGNIAATPDGRYVYLIFVGAVGPEENVEGYPMRGVYMAVSQDGGQTFRDYTVNVAPEGTAYGHQFPQVTMDSQGNVYAIYSDNQNLWMSVSTDHGQTWSSPIQVNHTGPVPSATDPYGTKGAWIANPNSSPVADELPEAYNVNPTPDSYYQQEMIPAYSNVAIEPWAVAEAPGKIDIVWYGTNMTYGSDGAYATDTTDDHVHWSVFMAQSTNALSSNPTFTEAPISPVVHRAGVSEAGVTSISDGEDNRDLYDDFGVTVNPKTGLASVAYTTDQLDPTDSTYYNSENNSDHTAVAEQQPKGMFTSIN
jgi:hypothetical protein